MAKGSGLMDWITTIASEARLSAIIRVKEFVLKSRVSESAVKKALRRYAAKGILEEVSKGLYLNTLASGFSARDVVNVVRPNAYISLESALAEWGISTQHPVALTCVGTLDARTIKTKSLNISYLKINETLFWGFQEKKTRYSTYKIAEPEKALLDWIYFSHNDGLPVVLDELRFENLSRSRLADYAKKYPSTVLKTLYFPLTEKQFAP
jgi:predicted transcriptional regulator of viral defense system